jgi:hypothetical protein
LDRRSGARSSARATRGRLSRRKPRHTTHHQHLPARVTVVRSRHPFEGKSLAVLGPTHRNGRLHLVLILPDGSKSLIPADWTDLVFIVPPKRALSTHAATLGSLEDLLHARAIVDALLSRLAVPESENASSAAKEEGSLATKSESLRPSSQRNLRVGNTGERPQDSRDRNPRAAHR